MERHRATQTSVSSPLFNRKSRIIVIVCMLYQQETAEALSVAWHLQNLVFQFHRPYPTSRESKLGSKWAGFEIPSSEVEGSTLLTLHFLRPDRVRTHCTNNSYCRMLSCGNLNSFYHLNQQQLHVGSKLEDPDTEYREDNIKPLNPTGYVMHQQFNIQQLYALPTLYLCVLYLSENKQRLVPLTA